MTLSRFTHPAVNDLVWLVEGHYIECDFDLSPYWREDITKCLRALATDPTPVEQALAHCKSHFMGSYFETLFSFAIEHLSTLIIQLEHVQIQEAGKTLGEIDILVKTPNGEFHQFEIAIKFYLERPDLAPHDWIGPNKNDSLLKKVTRAREHQLTMLHTKEGIAILEAVAKGQPAQASLLMFGRLYLALCDEASIRNWLLQTELGGWVRLSDLESLAPLFSHYIVLEKPHWMANPQRNASIEFCAITLAHYIGGAFVQDDRPKHVVFFSSVDPEAPVRPVFIVPDNW